MATLTKSTGTVTLSGAVEKVTFPAVYGWVWVKNMSDADMFVGLSDGVSAGADGVMRIPAGECGRVQTDGQDSVYLIGLGNALVVAQNYADCPFKVGGKGGEIPDLSAYAKKTDVPNIKVNAAVNADTVGGKLPEKIFYDNGMSSDLDSATKSGCYAASPDTLNAPASSWWLVDTMNFDNQFIVQKAHIIGSATTTVSYIRNYANNAWSDWTEMYTSGNKPYMASYFGGTAASFHYDYKPSFAIVNDEKNIKFGYILVNSGGGYDVLFENLSDTTHQYIIFK